MNRDSSPFVSQNNLFRYRFLVKRVGEDASLDSLSPEALDSSYGIPIWTRFEKPEGFDKRPDERVAAEARSPKNQDVFDFRIGWSNEALFVTVVVAKKKRQIAWSDDSLSVADSLRLCLDSRDLKDLRRATQYCHKLLFYPLVGDSLEKARPLAQWSQIARAKSSPNPVDVDEFGMASQPRDDGYAFSVALPSPTLTGFNPAEFNRLGVHFLVRDSQYGDFALQYAPPIPCEEDPSLWASFVFV